MNRQYEYQRAEKSVKAKLGFFFHLSIYVAVNVLLIIINFSTQTDYLWFKWPLMGWGIGVLFHALGVFVFSGKSAIIRQMVEKELEKEV